LKKTFSIFLIISFLFNTSGYLLIFIALQSQLKEKAFDKISSGIHNSGCIIISFDINELSKGIAELIFYDENEFSYKGNMYDVIKKEEKNDSVYFYCLADADEDELNISFHDNNEKKDKKSQCQNMPGSFLLECLIVNNTISPEFYSGLNYFNELYQNRNTNYLEVPTLPPIQLSV